MNKDTTKQPAYPAVPMATKFGDVVSPFPGWTRFEDLVIKIFCSDRWPECGATQAIEKSFSEAAELLQKFDELNAISELKKLD